MSNVGLVSAVIYTGLSLLAAAAFLAATLIGDHATIERLGGTLWVFILSMIILMPLVTPRVRKRIAGNN
jgi:hypothetical protein